VPVAARGLDPVGRRKHRTIRPAHPVDAPQLGATDHGHADDEGDEPDGHGHGGPGTQRLGDQAEEDAGDGRIDDAHEHRRGRKEARRLEPLSERGVRL